MRPPPISRQHVIDLYFIEHRGKLLDLAAFLDRIDRAAPASGAPASHDHRMTAFNRALAILATPGPDRTRRILELWSDQTTEPIAAAGMKGATGAAVLPPDSEAPARARQ